MDFNPELYMDKIVLKQWECRWHGVQDGTFMVNGTQFCALCIEKLLLDKLYPMKEKKTGEATWTFS